MKLFRIAAAFLLFAASMAASAAITPRFDDLERQLKIRPEQKEQYDEAVAATKRALFAVAASALELKQRFAEELMKARPDFNRLLENPERLIEQHRPLFKIAAAEWKKLFAQLDDEQIETAKRFLLDNLGKWGAEPFLEPQQKKPRIHSEEWI